MKKYINFEVILEIKILNNTVKFAQDNQGYIDIENNIFNEYFILFKKPITDYVQDKINEYFSKNNINRSFLNSIEIINYNAYSKEENIEVYFDKEDYKIPTLKCFVKQTYLTGKPEFTYKMTDYNKVKYIIKNDNCGHYITDENNNILYTLTNEQLEFEETIPTNVRRKVIAYNNKFISNPSDMYEINILSPNNIQLSNYKCDRDNKYNEKQIVPVTTNLFHSGIGYGNDCLLNKNNEDVNVSTEVQYFLKGLKTVEHDFYNKLSFEYRYKMSANLLKDSKNGNIKMQTRAYPILKGLVRLYKYAICKMVVKWKITAKCIYLKGNTIDNLTSYSKDISVEGSYTLEKTNLRFTRGQYATTISQNTKIGNIKELLLNKAKEDNDIKDYVLDQIYFVDIRTYDNYKIDTGDEQWIESVDSEGNILRETTTTDLAQDGSFRISNNSSNRPTADDDLYAIGKTDAQLYEYELIKEIEFNNYDYQNGYIVFDSDQYTGKLTNVCNNKLKYYETDIHEELIYLYKEHINMMLEVKNNQVVATIKLYYKTNINDYKFDFCDFSNDLSIYRFNSSYTSPEGKGVPIELYALCTKNDNNIFYKFTYKINGSSEILLQDYSSNNRCIYTCNEAGNIIFTCYISYDKINIIDKKEVINNVQNNYYCRSEVFNPTFNQNICTIEYFKFISGTYEIFNYNRKLDMKVEVFDSSLQLQNTYNLYGISYLSLTVDDIRYIRLTFTSEDGSNIQESDIQINIVNDGKENIKHIYSNGTSVIYNYEELFGNNLVKGLRYKFVTNVLEVSGNLYYNSSRSLQTGDVIINTGDCYMLNSFESKNYKNEILIEEYFPPQTEEGLHGIVNGNTGTILLNDGKNDFKVRCYNFKILTGYYNLNFGVIVNNAYCITDDNKVEINTSNINVNFLSSNGLTTSIPEDLITFSSNYKTRTDITQEDMLMSIIKKETFNEYGNHNEPIYLDTGDIDFSKYDFCYTDCRVVSNNVTCIQSLREDEERDMYIDSNLNVYKSADERWSPKIHNGYYYLKEQEYFLYSKSNNDDNCIKDIVYISNSINISINLTLKDETIEYIYSTFIQFDKKKHLLIDNLKIYLSTICRELNCKFSNVTSYSFKSDNCTVSKENNKLYATTNEEEIEEIITNNFEITDNEITIYDLPQQYAPITIIDDKNNVLYHLDNIEGDTDVIYINEEFICNKGSKIFLAYTNAKELSVIINDTVCEEDSYTLINNCLMLNNVKENDIIQVSYKLKNCFIVSYDTDGLSMYIRFTEDVNIAKIYYESNKESAYNILKHLSLNPIWNSKYSGFFYIDDKVREIQKININISSNILFINTEDNIKLYIEGLDENNNPVENESINISCKIGTIVLDNSKTDINGVISCTYYCPNQKCTDKITCSYKTLVATKEIQIKERKIY